MAPLLTVRNLTSTPMKLKHVERFKAESEVGSSIHHIGRNLTSMVWSNKTEPAAPRLATNAQSFFHRDLNFHVDPFQTQSTDVKPPDSGIGEVVRLTFEADGQTYRIDTFTAALQHASQSFTALDSQPKFEFTGVFLPEETFLAIYSSAQLYCWMKHLHDATPLSALSIPGTHNSPTCHKALPSVRCQAVSPRVQLENGIRFFDVRVQPVARDSSKLVLVHAVFPISLSGPKHLHSLLQDIYDFLDRNPSETLIMSLKREGTGNHSDQDLGHILYNHYTGGAEAHRWYTEPRVPTLGEVRGKIVLMRRFCVEDELHKAHDGRGWAIDAENWADNTAHDTHGLVCVQDFYEVLEAMNIDKKINFCEAQLERAAECVASLPGITTDPVHPVPPQPFYLNFLSASNFWSVNCWPEKIAEKLNPNMTSWLCKNHAQKTPGDGGTGIVVCDWVGKNGDWDLVRSIVGFNSKLMMREMSL